MVCWFPLLSQCESLCQSVLLNLIVFDTELTNVTHGLLEKFESKISHPILLGIKDNIMFVVAYQCELVSEIFIFQTNTFDSNRCELKMLNHLFQAQNYLVSFHIAHTFCSLRFVVLRCIALYCVVLRCSPLTC